jgi:hypothetical protein
MVSKVVFGNLANFLSISPNQAKPSLCRLFAWSQRDFSAISVSISQSL